MAADAPAEAVRPAADAAAPAGGERFRLNRYFAIASLLCTLLTAGALGWVYQHLALSALSQRTEAHNAGLARVLSNALAPRFAGVVAGSRARSREAMQGEAEAGGLRDAVIRLMRGSQVIKVKLYDRAGITVFSTDTAQIGSSARDNPGFLSAVGGSLRSDLTRRNTFDGFEGTLQQVDVLATYLPMTGDDGTILGVFEIYTDVSGETAQTRRTRTLMIAAVLALLGVLYAFLHLIVAHAQRVLDRQALALDRSLAAIEQANQALDQRVRERTRELSDANASLQAEVAERVAAERKLRLYAQVFESAAEGITITDARQRILAVNPAFTRVTGYAEHEMLGRTPRLLQSGRQPASFYEAMWASLRTTGHWQGEIWNRRKNGEVFPEWLSISAMKDSAGKVANYVAVFSDISTLKKSEDRIDYLAHHDVVTGLPNRLMFNQRVILAIDHAARGSGRFALVYLDLDHFKNINNSLGHHTGDAVLRAVATRLREGLRSGDTLARLGGDEFIALVENSGDRDAVAAVAQQMLDTLATPVAVPGHELVISTSIGIAVFPDDGADVHTLVKHADAAMYRAKAKGRHTFEFYVPEMTEGASERLRTESQLWHALENGEMRLYYQPQVDLGSGEIAGAEALVRWRHPQRGLVPPVDFIPITEESGLINELGAWAFGEACRQLREWDAAGLRLPRLAVNVSVRQIERSGFIERIAAILAETGVAPERIEIEITESVLIQAKDTGNLLAELRELGVVLSIDDFGTGFSSLSYLRRLPIDKLKIDQAFITDVTTNANDAAIVQSVIALARTLELTTVAEGVEDAGQVEFLRREGCDTAQGYHFSRPLTAEDFAAWLGAHPDGIRLPETAALTDRSG